MYTTVDASGAADALQQLHGPSKSLSICESYCGCHLDLQDGGKAAQKLMQPSPQSVDALKKIMDDARHKAGGAPPAHHKEHFNEEDYMDGELMDDDAHVHD